MLDKLFIKQLKENFPKLQITAIVRECDVINDATLKEARQLLFVKRFGLARYESVFVKEETIYTGRSF